jgi:GntR family transcriptional regulator
MLIRVDPQSSTPVFQQIIDQVKSAIARGVCAAGEAIPSVRQMASQVLVNPNTVAKAYRELEREGILDTRKGLGLFVAPGSQKTCRTDRRDAVRRKLAELVTEADQAGIPLAELRTALDTALRKAGDKPTTRRAPAR